MHRCAIKTYPLVRVLKFSSAVELQKREVFHEEDCFRNDWDYVVRRVGSGESRYNHLGWMDQRIKVRR